MSGKTHMTTGIVVSMAAVLPDTPKKMLICIAAGAIGGVISDIDVSTSDARREFNVVLGIAILFVLIAAGLEYQFQFGLVQMLEQHGFVPIAAGIAAFLVICVFGKMTPHRSFMHSILALLLLSASVWLILPQAVFSFAAAMMSHLALDLLNRRRVKLFYPLRRGVALDWCRSDGVVNRLLFRVALLLDVVIVAYGLFRCLML